MPKLRTNDRDLDEGLREFVNMYAPSGAYGLTCRFEDLDPDVLEDLRGDESEFYERIGRALEGAAEGLNDEADRQSGLEHPSPRSQA